MNDVKNPFLEPNKTVAVVGYLLLYILGSSFILLGFGMVYNFVTHTGLNLVELSKLLSETDFPKIEVLYRKLYVFSNSIGNFMVYLLSFIVVAFFMRNYLKDDAKGLILDYKKLAWLIPVCAGVGFGLALLVDYGIGEAIHRTSANQSSIEVLIKNGGAVWMFFAVVIFAPIVEELIYRKAIFEYLKKFPIVLSYVVSTLLFTFPHMVTTFMDMEYTIAEKFLLCIPYLLSGVSLCVTYHLCNKNIYASWFFHFVNNLLSFIILCL